MRCLLLLSPTPVQRVACSAWQKIVLTRVGRRTLTTTGGSIRPRSPFTTVGSVGGDWVGTSGSVGGYMYESPPKYTSRRPVPCARAPCLL